MKKRKTLVAALILVFALSIPTFAATANFSATIPAKQGDTEVSTVARAGGIQENQFFDITLQTLTAGYSSLRAWAEVGTGTNVSSPYQEALVKHTTRMKYTRSVLPRVNVTLNLDNPVYTTSKLHATGQWTPY